ncbi:patatin-like phospholipase family protein [Chelativorans sp. ZYF759]|uniref:patatin-like phospholipase family protein n=1 Tax=Chelativorans sp. ZYF759 TaxID=2692213 RepID=UPI001FEF0DDC|nr:patatin-like phospholipase family protein [Chelativorans sp. ZYF759]
MRPFATFLAGIAAALLAGCVAGDRGPINVFVAEVGPASPEFIPDPGDDGSLVVGLAFSGGGARAAAFAYGVLRELDEAVIDEVPYRRTMVDDIRMISGTSGGAIMAAYFGYRGPDEYRDFRERFLLQNAESALRTSMNSPANLARAWSGGVNDRSAFARWLDRNLFEGATFERLKRSNAPIVWLTASDIYNGTPFLFTYDTFAALCSDLDQVRLADAVAASAAFPVVFAPVMLAADAPDCGYRQPAWKERALTDRETPLRLAAYARALDSYRGGQGPSHVRLLDGGLTDNIGITGFALERAAATTPHGPLSPAEAVKLDRLLYIVTDAGRERAPVWGASARGPGLPDLLAAVSDTAISSSTREGFDALELEVAHWRNDIVRYRCGLSMAEIRKHRGTLDGWDCRNVRLAVEHVSFRSLDAETKARLDQVPTRLSLQQAEVDFVIEAGRRAIRSNPSVRDALAHIQRKAGVGAAHAW